MNRRWRAFHKRIYSNAQGWYELDLDYNYFYLAAAMSKGEREELARVVSGGYRAGTMASVASWLEIKEHA